MKRLGALKFGFGVLLLLVVTARTVGAQTTTATILGSVDVLPSLSGLVGTGGRLNLA